MARRPGSRAFTLVEMLVAVSIIAILVALILAVYGVARGKSKEVVCIDHLRQLGHALAMYRADHDGLYPPYDSRALNPLYVDDARIWFCPADDRRDSTIPPSAQLVAWGFGAFKKSPSYFYDAGGAHFAQLYARRGEASPIMGDDWHTSLADKQALRWRWLVLRADGSVSQSVVSGSTSSDDL